MPTTPASRSPAVAEILRRLARLRARVRGIALRAGAARVLLLAVGCFALSFLADRWLDLPMGVRRFLRFGLLDKPTWLPTVAWVVVVFLLLAGLVAALRRGRLAPSAPLAFVAAGGAGILAWGLLTFLRPPARARLTDDALALRVEDRFRRLNDRLAAALDFDRALAEGKRGESAAMMRRVVEEAGREAKTIEFGEVANARVANRRLSLAVLSVAAFVAVLVALPATAALWARRSLLLEDVAWPRRTTLVAVLRDADGREREADPAVPYVAALGQGLSVLARAKGEVPDEVEILDRLASDPDGRPLPHRMRPVAGVEGLFEHEFRDVRGDFSFTLRGGDDRDEEPSWHVTVRIPPRITGLYSDLLFPAYLRLPPRRVEGGTLTVPEGTQVTVTFEADAGVDRAEAWIDDAPVPVERVAAAAPAPAPAEGRPAAGAAAGAPSAAATTRSWKLSFEAKKSLRYRLRIVTADGRENEPGVDAYEVAVLPDTAPAPEWVYPRAPLETSPRGRVPLFVRTRDDHGIASLALEVRTGDGEPLRVPLVARSGEVPDGANDRPYGADEIWSYVALEVPSLKDGAGAPIAAPARVQARLTAVDSKGQEGAGEWASIDVVRADEIERRLAGQRAGVRSDVEGILGDLGKLRDSTAEVAKGTIADPERVVLRELQFKQGKLRGDVDRVGRALAGFFLHYVYDRLGADVPTEKVLGLLDRRHRTLFARREAAAPGAPAGDDTAGGGDETEVFPWSLYREVVDARRDRLVYDTGVLDRMISVLEQTVPAVETDAPAAANAAVEASTQATPESIRALAAAQETLAKRLHDVLDAMHDWQTLSDLTMTLRRLIEDQELIDKNLRRIDEQSKGASPGVPK